MGERNQNENVINCKQQIISNIQMQQNTRCPQPDTKQNNNDDMLPLSETKSITSHREISTPTSDVVVRRSMCEKS